MLEQVKKYISRKGIQEKLKVDISEPVLNALDEIVLYFGENVFTRHKSNFSQQVVENTIPTMINNGIIDLKGNLIAE